MRWLRRQAGPPDSEVELQRVADDLRAAATAAPPSDRADEIRATLLARLDAPPRATPRLGLSSAWLVVPMLVLLAALVGLLAGAPVEPSPEPAVPTQAQPSGRTTDIPASLLSPGASPAVGSETPAGPASPPAPRSPLPSPETGTAAPSASPDLSPMPTPPTGAPSIEPPVSLPPTPSLEPPPIVP